MNHAKRECRVAKNCNESQDLSYKESERNLCNYLKYSFNIANSKTKIHTNFLILFISLSPCF